MTIVKVSVLVIMTVGLAVIVLSADLPGRADPAFLQSWLRSLGVWAPLGYILLYTIATVFVLPSTPLNLLGGALFGPWLGTVWSSIGAMLAAIATFTFTRTIGRHTVAQKLSGRWQIIDREVRRGGLFYMIAIRLVPFMPYGLLNFAAGLTSVSYRDYVLGTLVGTTPGILPYVLLGSSGSRAVRTGDLTPLIGALTLAGILIAGSTWYRRRTQRPNAHLPPDPPSECIDPRDR